MSRSELSPAEKRKELGEEGEDKREKGGKRLTKNEREKGEESKEDEAI